MGFLDRLFNRNRISKAATAADVTRGQKLQGHEVGQTLGEQAATRGRMEAEMDAQRQRREQPPTCLHVTLVPRWNSVAEMGDEAKASGYQCDSCHQSFTADEGRALRLTEAARLAQVTKVDG